MENINTEIQEFDNALLDVRKAYRLLYQYQRRVMDLADYIGNHWNFLFTEGQPWFSSALPKGKNIKLNRWAWDWLYMYYYDFYFEREYNGDILKLGIIIQSDTGYFDVDTFERLNIDEFAEPKNSETRLIFLLIKGEWCSKHIRENNSFGKNKTEGIIPFKENDDTIGIYKVFNLKRFYNESTTLEALKEFEEYAICHIPEFEIKENYT